MGESSNTGNGCWLKGSVPVSYLDSATDYVQFGFFRGSALRDPQGLLEGKGQYVRHIKVRKPSSTKTCSCDSCGKRRGETNVADFMARVVSANC